MAQEFLQILREKRDSTIAVNEQRARVGSAELISLQQDAELARIAIGKANGVIRKKYWTT
jgi:hypothetical protein